MFNGMRVMLCPVQEVPKRQLSESVPVTDEFRTEFNMWMKSFFGVDIICSVKEDEVLQMGDTLWMRESMWNRVKEAMK